MYFYIRRTSDDRWEVFESGDGIQVDSSLSVHDTIKEAFAAVDEYEDSLKPAD